MHYGYYDYVEPRRWLDWVVGIALGIVLGVAVVAAFVFLGSEETIDAPSIQGIDTGKPAQVQSPETGAPALQQPAASPEGSR